ncbi:DinB family protein [Granulicella arctica]|uniref:DinB-like domain-containing protein n=1 Tax=Granulicella arctica TaxID=940613 RepID=A0A7Y9TRI3_9BACT|nr:DinB family protein [Granulicella arctica]NYF78223.1 hypothetical protein [Granulicella arctica]
MAVTYAHETPLAELDPVELGIRLAELVAETMVWLEGVSGLRASVAPAEGKWSAKETMGHLVDSAVNNLQRIVRLEVALDSELEVRAQGYEQDGWVRAQRYADKEWSQVLELWRTLNEHIGWTMRQVSREHLARICAFPDTQVTMGFLMEDYIAHIEYHLRALREWL